VCFSFCLLCTKQLRENPNCLFVRSAFNVLCALFLELGTVADSGSVIKLKMLIAVYIMDADDTSYDSLLL